MRLHCWGAWVSRPHLHVAEHQAAVLMAREQGLAVGTPS